MWVPALLQSRFAPGGALRLERSPETASDSGVLKRANVQTNPASCRIPCGTLCTFVQRNPIIFCSSLLIICAASIHLGQVPNPIQSRLQHRGRRRHDEPRHDHNASIHRDASRPHPAPASATLPRCPRPGIGHHPFPCHV